jgi:hypothetical protein
MDAARQLGQGPLPSVTRPFRASAGRMAHRLLDSCALYLRLETCPPHFCSFGLAVPLRALMDPWCVAKAWVTSAPIRIICDV